MDLLFDPWREPPTPDDFNVRGHKPSAAALIRRFWPAMNNSDKERLGFHARLERSQMEGLLDAQPATLLSAAPQGL